MARKILIPFGPQHPVLPEPIHFDLVTEDEKVIDAIPSISYVHRGLERLVEKRDFIDFAHVADRICGLCSFMHSLRYCQAVEEIMGIEVPDRTRYLRTVWAELSRIHSHILLAGGCCRRLRLREPVHAGAAASGTGAQLFRGDHRGAGYPGPSVRVPAPRRPRPSSRHPSDAACAVAQA